MNNKPTFKFKTNIPSRIHFQVDEPQIGMGLYGEWYRYEVVVDDQEQVLFASKGLQDKLSKLGHLFGRTLEINKREGSGNKIYWEVKEEGLDITPGMEVEKQQELPLNLSDEDILEKKINELEKRLNKAAIVVREISERLEKTEEKVNRIRVEERSRKEG